MAFNQLRPPFQDVHVRRAIAYALDREAMVTSVLYGNGQAADSLLSPGTPFYAENPDAPTFDLATAKQELAQSSQPGGFSTTILINAVTRTRCRSRRSCSPSSRSWGST